MVAKKLQQIPYYPLSDMMDVKNLCQLAPSCFSHPLLSSLPVLKDILSVLKTCNRSYIPTFAAFPSSFFFCAKNSAQEVKMASFA